MSSPSDTSKCVASSSSNIKEEAEISSNKKVSTPCDQKVEHCTVDIVVTDISRVDISDDTSSISNGDDDKLFRDPPPMEDCPICMLPLPFTNSGTICGVRKTYMACCGKVLCDGCSIAEDDEMRKGNIKSWCALCRVPLPDSDEELMKRYEKRMNMNDGNAFLMLGCQYQQGGMGLTQDFSKAVELWNRAAELGSVNAHYALADAYYHGDGAEKDAEKANHHWKLAAIGGNEIARHNLGAIENNNGNIDLSTKHYIIAAKSGNDKSLKQVGEGYKRGHVTKNEYASTLRAHQCIQDEMKSEQRTKVMMS